jgi:ABC-2 type transport system ATP-binding protein
MNPNTTDLVPALEVRELVKRYGDLCAVDHLSLEVRRGEVFGFLGPNGAGKTTAIRMMCGLLKPTSGEVLVEGESLGAQGGAELRSRVGICPQENILWSKLSCFEQLVFTGRMYNVPGDLARKRADDLLVRMGLEDKRNKLAASLSGGMKRRMNVIMALMHDPTILVFDEPEAGLDPQSRVVVREFIREMALERTVIITTHNMDEADRLANRVAIIDAGKLLKLDSPGNLKRSIGQGDILELKPVTVDSEAVERIEKDLRSRDIKFSMEAGLLKVRSKDLVSRIPEIYKLLEKEGISVVEMRLRENSLEDVFIHLTGKSLRS